MLCHYCGAETPVSQSACVNCGTSSDVLGDGTGPEPHDERSGAAPDDVPTSLEADHTSAGAKKSGTDEGPLVPGEPFGSRYRILERLGGGGMGVVYKAWDETLEILVAIKVIRPRVMSDAYVARDLDRRFKRELLFARQVTHKNVVRIHDLGEIDGIKYITMSYALGSDLASVLRKEGRLPCRRTLPIARQLAAGLEAAHEAGVVHRDLKPQNVMLDENDDPLIMDFGIARSVRRSPDGEAVGGARNGQATPGELTDGLTIPGTIVGTLEYMAPEQALGRNVDERADLYAFGLILYDMLVGLGHHKLPRRISSAEEVVAQRPVSARSVDPNVPEAVDRIIRRCLARAPEDRFQSASEVRAELEKLDDEGRPLPVALRLGRSQAALAALVGLVALLGTWWLARTPPAPEQLSPVSVLVADFQNATGDAGFDGALEQALAAGMESASFVTVYGRHDARELASELTQKSDLDESAARLVATREGIDVVLSGAIDGGGSDYSVVVKVIDPSPDGEVHVERSRASSRDDVLDAVVALAARVRERLGDTAGGSDPAGRETFTAASLEAARAYADAQGLAMSYRDEEAIERYLTAIELDPSFGRAYAGLAYSAFRLGRLEESEAAWQRALSLIDRMTEREKYRTLGLYYGTISRNYDKAIENYEALLHHYPADDAGHNNLAMSYFSARRFDEALEAGRRALEIYPSRLMYRVNYALFSMYASEFARAEEEAKRILEDRPDLYDAYLPIAIAALDRGDFREAQEAYRRLGDSGARGASLAAIGLADVALYRGRFEEATKILSASIAADAPSGHRAFLAARYVALAEAHLGAGRSDVAIASIERALEERAGDEVLLPAGRILLRGGAVERALELARELSFRLEPQSRAYADVIEGEVALEDSRHVEALEAFESARKLADPWLARFDLGVLYVAAGRYPEALSELEMCLARKGEASALFLDDIPTYRYVATVPYWLGRAQEGLGMRDASEQSYRAYLSLRGDDLTDPLAADARRRLDLDAR